MSVASGNDSPVAGRKFPKVQIGVNLPVDARIVREARDHTGQLVVGNWDRALESTLFQLQELAVAKSVTALAALGVGFDYRLLIAPLQCMLHSWCVSFRWTSMRGRAST